MKTVEEIKKLRLVGETIIKPVREIRCDGKLHYYVGVNFGIDVKGSCNCIEVISGVQV